MITNRELYWEREFKLSQFQQWQKENLLPPLKGCQQVPKCLISITDVDRIVWPGAFVHSFKDDYKFDGRNGVWHQTEAFCAKFLLKRFGALTPDFSAGGSAGNPHKGTHICYNRQERAAQGHHLL